MNYDPAKHHRRSIRLKGYDYSRSGAYFITICINQGLHTLGEIRNNQIYPSEPGKMVQTIWDELPLHYPGVDVDTFVLMPNHIHGIIFLTNNTVGAVPPHQSSGCPPHSDVATNNFGATTQDGATTGGLPLQSSQPMKLADVVHRFKSLTTAKYRHGVTQLAWEPFPKRFWQRNYYEKIIRDQDSLNKIREYILNNPLTWESEPTHLQKYHPKPY